MKLLVGDIGGTKTILGLFSTENGPRVPLVEKIYHSAQYQTFEAIVQAFQAEIQQKADAACFGVAGPIVDGRGKVTNLTWEVDGEKLQSQFGWHSVILLNDLKAVAYAVPILRAEDLHTLNAGQPVKNGSMAVIAPGTGLGESYLTFDGHAYRAYPSEGSHVSFGPVGELQIGLLRYLNGQGFHHVSFERVCSGGLGIPHLYDYLKSTGVEEPDWLAEKLAAVDDPTPVIFDAAQDQARHCPLAVETVELFVSILGAEAGNLALKILSTGGVYLGGGISPRIIPELEKPAFLEAFRSKGRFRQLLTDMPVHVILNAKAGLLGAAAVGLKLSAA
ncbi:MAG: glucokinase [Anaerolineales bacterium]|jgi:glucokinase